MESRMASPCRGRRVRSRLFSYIHMKKKTSIMPVLTLRWHLVIQIKQQKEIYLHNTYNLYKDLDPILQREHWPLCQRQLYYHGFNNNTIIKQDSWHKTGNNTQSLTWHIGKTCKFMHNYFFLSTPNFSILKLCSYQPSCWAHGRSVPPKSEQVVLAPVNKRKNKNLRTVRLKHAATFVSPWRCALIAPRPSPS